MGSLPSVEAATAAVFGLPPPEALPTAAPKWSLFLKVLPLTALFALAKVGVHTLGFEPWVFDSLTGSLFGASTFVLAFVLSGTLAAYRASEDMVVQSMNAIESIEDINNYVARLQPSLDTARLTSCLADLNQILADLRRYSGDSVVDRGLPELASMRILVNRMASNRDSDFLGPAYAMLEIFLVGAIVALLLIGAERFSENMVVSCFLFISFTHLLLLIRDLDNPFIYDGSSCVDVDLSVLNSCRQRLLARRGATPDSACLIEPD